MDKKVIGLVLITLGLFLIWCALRGYSPIRIAKEILTTGKYNPKIAEYDIKALGVTGEFVPVNPGQTAPATPNSNEAPGSPTVVPA